MRFNIENINIDIQKWAGLLTKADDRTLGNQKQYLVIKKQLTEGKYEIDCLTQEKFKAQSEYQKLTPHQIGLISNHVLNFKQTQNLLHSQSKKLDPHIVSVISKDSVDISQISTKLIDRQIAARKKKIRYIKMSYLIGVPLTVFLVGVIILISLYYLEKYLSKPHKENSLIKLELDQAAKLYESIDVLLNEKKIDSLKNLMENGTLTPKMQSTLIKIAEHHAVRSENNNNNAEYVSANQTEFPFLFDQDGDLHIISKKIAEGADNIIFEALSPKGSRKYVIGIRKSNDSNFLDKEQKILGFYNKSETEITPGYKSILNGQIGNATHEIFLQKRFEQGQSLKNEPLSLQFKVFGAIANALALIHKNKQSHNDIHKGNFVYDKSGKGYLIDFALCSEKGYEIDPSEDCYDFGVLLLDTLFNLKEVLRSIKIPDEVNRFPYYTIKTRIKQLPEKELQEFFQTLASQITSKMMSQSEQAMQLELLKIAADLLKIEVNKRSTAGETSVYLQKYEEKLEN